MRLRTLITAAEVIAIFLMAIIFCTFILYLLYAFIT